MALSGISFFAARAMGKGKSPGAIGSLSQLAARERDMGNRCIPGTKVHVLALLCSRGRSDSDRSRLQKRNLGAAPIQSRAEFLRGPGDYDACASSPSNASNAIARM